MATISEPGATLDDLAREPGKAELIDGKIVRFLPTGRKPNRVAGRVFRSLDEYAEHVGGGEAYTDNIGFAIPRLPSGRQSFSPDASYFTGPFPAHPLRFLDGPPTFAVEVRGEGDHDPSAEQALAAKRADYFAAGTLAVWDVDPVADFIHVYRHTDPSQAMTYGRGQFAEAEPAVPGWKAAVDWIFA
ncbi:MAG TPA: Uma2 family endonuclease [Isosphaeraceae bacterium]|jgi:Uma2 family endonuclease|nr:Uma2 family endonuclease [Isosphaeraceae bacterium]